MEDRGLARPPLGLLETLRPWHGAGLLHVLLPEGQGAASGDAPVADAAADIGPAVPGSAPGTESPDMRAFSAACDAPRSMQGEQAASRSAAYATSGNGGDPSFDPDAYDIPPDPMGGTYPQDDASMGHGAYSAPTGTAGYGAGRAQELRQPPPRPSQPTPPVQPPRQGAYSAPAADLAQTLPPVGSGLAASSLPPEQWPDPWRVLLGKTPHPAPVLWTYWALGLDLSGCADAARRDTLRRILGALQQPRGSNAFWPIAMPESGAEAASSSAGGTADGTAASATEPVCDTGLFLAGVERIAPRLVVVMGSKALRAFAPDLRARPYQQIPWRGRLLIVLPDMDNLIAAPATVEAVIAYLRTALKPAAL